MLVSRNWLQSHIENEIPSAEDIAQTLLLHAFEIEGVEQQGQDSIIDIDVLPNRAHDCLSHRGVATELAGLLKYKINEDRYVSHNVNPSLEAVAVDVQDTESCLRYSAVRINSIKVEESQDWIKQSLVSIGQKSINNIVDATNYVMFDLGQPLHAFDADKVIGGITVRKATEGETMTTLLGEDLVLGTEDLVIADDEGVLALAGIKGGNKAEVTGDTKNIILEAANFDAVSTRKTSRRVKIQTDSSKRYENELSPVLVEEALQGVCRILLDVAKTDGVAISSVTDVYPYSVNSREINLRLGNLNKILGTTLSEEEVSFLFKQFNFEYRYNDGTFTVQAPDLRLDLLIEEDLIEEIGRWYGYHNIPSASLSGVNSNPKVHALTDLINKIKNVFLKEGYTELLTYSFVKKGEISVFNPIASDKQSLRTNIHKQLKDVLEKNARNASYFGKNNISVFEIGRVYLEEGEKTMCAFTCVNTDKRARKMYGDEASQLESTLGELKKELGLDIEVQENDGVISFCVDDLIDSEKKMDSYTNSFDLRTYQEEARFKTISVYQHSTRDVSLWVTEGTQVQDIEDVIKEKGGEHLKKVYLFDEFTKDGKTSYAFSLVFQSNERTLEDSDLDGAMTSINQELESKGWEVR